MSKSKNVLFLMTGSIACYKACQVISRLRQNNISVQVVTTSSALKFIGAATLEGLSGKPIISDLFATGQMMSHIHLIRNADLILVAPATAHYINKIAQGLGDDLASTLFLAHDFKKPFLVAPAMNTTMYLHPITQRSVNQLRSLGVEILDSASGVLACGEVGYGKLLDPDLILQEVMQRIEVPPRSNGDELKSSVPSSMATKQPLRVLVTAGGTQENIDQVRAITNLSTGRTGFQISQSLSDLGIDVTLLLAKNSYLNQWPGIEFGGVIKTFTDYSSLSDLLFSELQNQEYDFLIHCAAVSDYSIASVESDQGKKPTGSKLPSSENLVLKLKRNVKLIDSVKVKSKNKKLKLIGFKLTSESSPEQIQDKVSLLFQNAKCDFVVHNDTRDIESKSDPMQSRHGFNIYESSDQGKNKKTECKTIDDLAFEISQIVIKQETL